MSADLIAIGVLAAVGLIWLYINLKTNRTSTTKTLSLLLAWAFLLGASVAAVAFAWGVLTS